MPEWTEVRAGIRSGERNRDMARGTRVNERAEMLKERGKEMKEQANQGKQGGSEG